MFYYVCCCSRSISMKSFHPPERKDRHYDYHGGVIVYVKESLYYKRRSDLESGNLECIWIEIILRNKRVLCGTLYRPPNSDSTYFSLLEESMGLAYDTGIRDIIITGYFNINILTAEGNRKISSLCQQFGLTQLLQEPTHFTEHSSSLIDLFLISNVSSCVLSKVLDPFLEQNIRFQCPIAASFNFVVPKTRSFIRRIYKYDACNYNTLLNSIHQLTGRILLILI